MCALTASNAVEQRTSRLTPFLHVRFAANNGVVGSIPDVYDDTSPLQYLSARNNMLTGTIPATLGLAGDLQVLALSTLKRFCCATVPMPICCGLVGHPRV